MALPPRIRKRRLRGGNPSETPLPRPGSLLGADNPAESRCCALRELRRGSLGGRLVLGTPRDCEQRCYGGGRYEELTCISHELPCLLRESATTAGAPTDHARVRGRTVASRPGSYPRGRGRTRSLGWVDPYTVLKTVVAAMARMGHVNRSGARRQAWPGVAFCRRAHSRRSRPGAPAGSPGCGSTRRAPRRRRLPGRSGNRRCRRCSRRGRRPDPRLRSRWDAPQALGCAAFTLTSLGNRRICDIPGET